MCGLLAVFSVAGALPADAETRTRKALQTLRHRGPDDEGVYAAPTVVLAHRRLSIMDLSTAGHQPMLSDDGRVALVFNGQIYNWRELRQQLEAKGHVFHSRCDTEAVLHAYLEYGADFARHLVGMWAIVIWDARSRSLVVSRDRLGIKPLYVAQHGDTLLFASEIKALLAFDGGVPRLNRHVLSRYITRGWLDDIPETLYEGIRSFPAAGLSVWREGHGEHGHFWHYPVPQQNQTDLAVWRDTFIRVIEDHIQSDAMLATTLSGGLDSSAINSVLARTLGRARDVQAFSLLAPDIPDETPLIDETVKALGINHQYIDVGSIDYVSAIDDLLRMHDEPTYSAGQVNQFIFRQHINRMGYKVLLVGDGADEILAGYAKILPLYVESLLADGRNAEAEAALLGSVALTDLSPERQMERVALLRQRGIGRRVVQEYRFGYQLFAPEATPDDAVLCFDKTHRNLAFLRGGDSLYRELMDRMTVDIPQVLRNEDRNGMASSMEIRPPFLDHRLYEQSWAYAYPMMMEGGGNKQIMRRALDGIIPAHVLNNRKKFVRPGSVRNLVYEALDQPLRAMLATPSEISSDLWRADLPALYESSRACANTNEALVWLRYYMLRRTLCLRFGDRDAV